VRWLSADCICDTGSWICWNEWQDPTLAFDGLAMSLGLVMMLLWPTAHTP
jgi:hypothetical protein